MPALRISCRPPQIGSAHKAKETKSTSAALAPSQTTRVISLTTLLIAPVVVVLDTRLAAASPDSLECLLEFLDLKLTVATEWVAQRPQRVDDAPKNASATRLERAVALVLGLVPEHLLLRGPAHAPEYRLARCVVFAGIEVLHGVQAPRSGSRGRGSGGRRRREECRNESESVQPHGLGTQSSAVWGSWPGTDASKAVRAKIFHSGLEAVLTVAAQT